MNSKRLLTLLLVFCMVFSVLSPTAGAIGVVSENSVTEQGKNTSTGKWFNDLLVSAGEALGLKTLRDDQSHVINRDQLNFVNGQWTATSADGVSVVLTDAELPEDIQALRKAAENYAALDVVYAFVTLEADPTAEQYSSILDVPASMTNNLTAQQNALIAEIEAKVLGGRDLKVVSQFTYLTNSVVIAVEFGKLEEIADVSGVKSVFLNPVFEACKTTDTVYPATESSSQMTNVASVWQELGYTGAGMTIAILDTGLDLDHPSFAADPAGASWDVEWLQEMLDSQDLNLETLYGKEITAEDLFYSNKVPFAFNYATGTTNVLHNDQLGDHGTHVAGIAAANKVEGTEVVGMAPDAQIIAMKVFSPQGGAGMDTIVAALEDCMKLGVDVANLSLGSAAGFSESDVEEIDSIFRRISETDLIVDVAAGNEGTSTYGSKYGYYMQLTDHIETGTIASPSTYANSMAIGSVDNKLVATDCFRLADGTGIAYMYSVEYIYGQITYTLSSLHDLGELEYVVLDGVGKVEEFYDADGMSTVAGKVAVIPRGEITFGEKIANAESAGAVAAIIWNADDSDIFSFGMTTAVTDAEGNSIIPGIPVGLITHSDGQKMADAETKTMYIPDDYMFREDPAGGQMSSFSCWGTTSDLRLVPDIAGVGGSVFSCYDGGYYGVMSGTSMACPQVAGVTALVVQYLKETFPDATEAEMRVLVDSLLMSTAVTVIDQDTSVEASPRQQGAGLVDALAAITSQAYLTVEGSARPKAELKDNANGEFSFTFTVHNFSNAEKTYALRSSLLCEDYITDEAFPGLYFMAEEDRGLDNSAVTFSSETVTVAAGGTAEVTVTIKLTEADKTWIDTYFPNGNYVEGFVYLEGEDEVTLSVPFMGFYGRWDAAPLFDEGFWFDEGTWLGDYGYITANQYPHYLFTSLGDSDYDWVLGMNPYAGPQYYVDENGMPRVYYNPANNVVSPNGDGLIDGITDMYLSQMRNAEDIQIVLTDAEGNIVDQRNLWKESKTMFISSYGQTVPTVYSWTYDEYVDFSTQPHGTELFLTIYGVIDYEGAEADYLVRNMPIIIDTQAPVLDTTKIVESTDESGNNYITVTFADEHPAAAFLANSAGTSVYQSYYDLDMEYNEDGTCSITMDVTGLGDQFMLILADYGCNEAYYELTWSQTGTNNPEMDETALYAYQVYNEYVNAYYGWDAMFGWTTIDKVTAQVSMLQSDALEYYAINAAEYVDGYIFAVDAGGNFLYMVPGVWNRQIICNLGLNVVDMAFDETTGTMYLATTDKENYSYCLYTVDMLTGETELLWDYGSQSYMPWAMTCVDGELYCCKYYRAGFYKVDFENYYTLVPVTLEDGTEFQPQTSAGKNVQPYYAQSMTYSKADGKIYWAYYSYSGSEFITIDPATWTSTATAFMYDQEYVGLLTLEEKDYTLPASEAVTKLLMSEEQIIMSTDQRYALSVTMLPWNAPVTEDVLWSTSDETVATVDNGVVTSVSEGVATITASYGDLTAECTVNVVNVDGHMNAYKFFDGFGNYGYWLDIDLKNVTEEGTVASPIDFISADYNGHTGITYGYTEAGQCYWFNPETGEYGALGTADKNKVPADMAYDYSTGMMYAIVKDFNNFCTTLYALNMKTGELVEQAVVYGNVFVTLACSMDGQLYGINYLGELYELYVLEGEGMGGGGGIMPWFDDDDFGVGGETGAPSYYIETLFVMQVTDMELQYAQTMCYDHNNNVLLWICPETSSIYWLDGLGTENPFMVALGDPSGSGLIQYTGAYVVPEEIPELPFIPVSGASAEDMLLLVGQSKPANVSVLPLNATAYTVYNSFSTDESVAYYDEATGTVVAVGTGTAQIGLGVVDLGEDLVDDGVTDPWYDVYFTVTVKEPTDNIYGYLVQDIASMDGYYWINIPDTNPTEYQPVEYVYWEGAYMTLYAAEYVDGKIYAYGFNDGDWNANFQFLTIDVATWSVIDAVDMGDAFPFVYDMAFDYTTGTMYALAGPSSNTTDLYYVNMANGQLIECMATGDEYMFMNLTIDAEGTIYAIAASVEEMDWETWASVLLPAQMYTLDPATGAIEWFMDTGVASNMLTSMAYDHDTGYIYWHAMDAMQNSGLYLIDLEEKAAYMLGTVGAAGSQVTSLMVLADSYPEVPDTLQNLNMLSSVEELAIGDTVALELFMQPATVEVSLAWASADESVATVDENGVVTGIAAGTTTITVTATDAEGNVKTATCTIIVYGVDDYFITYNKTDRGFAMISRPDSTIVTNFTEGEEIGVQAMAMINGMIYAYDEENNLFVTSQDKNFERTYIGNAGIAVDEPYEDHTENIGSSSSYGYDSYYTPAFVIRDMAYDAANDRLLVLGCNVLNYVTYYWYHSESYNTEYEYARGFYEMDGGCKIYTVDLATGAISELCVVGGENYESGVTMFTVADDGTAYTYSYYMDYVMKLDLETGAVTYTTTFQNQGASGSSNGDLMSMTYDAGTDSLYMLFTQNGKYYQLYKFDPTTQMISLVDYVGEVNYVNYSYSADLFAGLVLNEEHVCKYESVVTPATCTTHGITTHTCVQCGDVYYTDYVEATGHTYETTVVEATCTEDGSITYTCHCGDSYVEILEATGHNFVDGACEHCGELDAGNPDTGSTYSNGLAILLSIAMLGGAVLVLKRKEF